MKLTGERPIQGQTPDSLLALHDAVVFGRFPSPEILCAVVLLGLISMGGGYWVFQKAKQVFFDYA